MCLIVDTSVLRDVITAAVDYKPVNDALIQRKAVAVYGGQLAREYSEMKRVFRLIVELDRMGAFRKLPDADVDEMTVTVTEEGFCRSNDQHVIALARVSGVRLLCSDDRDLHRDFINVAILRPKGSVYQNRSHQHLLRSHCFHS